MGNGQVPIGSGFGARTTSAQVLAGLDLAGKLAIVTGGYSGLGLETTRALAGAGACVVVAARRIDAARENIGNIRGVEIEELDLSDPESISGFAKRFIATQRHADIVINNAGIMACPEMRVGHGWEAQFAINHLGHYALVNHLWPALAGGARVVAVSSAGHHLSGIRWDDLQFHRSYDKWQAYGQSKTATVLFARHLDLLGKAYGIHAFSVDPGKIFTPLQRYLTKDEMIAAGWLDANGGPADSTFKTPQQGAATQVWAATYPQLEGVGGVYCEDCDVAEIATSKEPSFTGVRNYAIDVDQAARLWTLSSELTGLNTFSGII